jgi:hypothetical protein
MKKWFLGLGLLVWCGGCFAQSMAEMVETMGQQIAVLTAYGKVVEKGYSLVENGLKTVQSIRKGEFDLHDAFYASLKTVNPALREMAEVAEIISLELSMVSQVKTALAGCRSSAYLGSDEAEYVGRLYGVLLQEALADVNALAVLLTDDQVQLEDGERMRRVGAIDGRALGQYRLMQQVNGEVMGLVAERQDGLRDVGALRGMYGLP